MTVNGEVFFSGAVLCGEVVAVAVSVSVAVAGEGAGGAGGAVGANAVVVDAVIPGGYFTVVPTGGGAVVRLSLR